MGLSSAASTELLTYNPVVDAKLELSNNFGQSWQEYVFGSCRISFRDEKSMTLDADLLNDAFSFSDETNQAKRTQLEALARLTVYIGAESKVLFEGRVKTVDPSNQKFKISAFCYREDLNETSCKIYREPSTISVVSGATRREITQIDAAHQPHVFGFALGAPVDPAFNEARTARRSWVRNGVLEIWKDAVSTDTDDQVAPSKFNVDWTSGVVEIFIPVGELAGTYYIKYVDAYLETFATGADNCDFARLIQDMLTYRTPLGGPGFILGTHYGNEVVSVNAGLKQIVIAGDYRKWYPDNAQVFVQPLPPDGTGNTYTVNGTPSYGGGSTTITVDQVPAVPVGDAAISRDTGFDIDRPMDFDDKCNKLLQALSQQAQQNLRIFYHPDTGRFMFYAVTQAETPDWTLLHPKEISLPRGDRDLYTRIIRTGETGFPINDVHDAAADTPSRLTDITTGTPPPSFFKWDGQNISMDGSAFADVQQYLYDGDANKACMAHQLTAPADEDGDASSKYIGWYYFFEVDLGSVKTISRARATMPGSRNPNAGAGHQGIFWPGLKVLVSEDGVNYSLLSVDMYGRYSPGSQLDITKDRIQRSRARYVKVLCGAYKEGDSNQSDPAIGLAEFELYTTAQYKVKREISPLIPIVDVDMATDYFELEGEEVYDDFAVGDTFTVVDSTGNDGNYTVTALDKVGGNTRLSVAVVPNAVADGYLYSTTDYEYLNGTPVTRDYPDLWVRFGRKFKEDRQDFGSQYSAPVAGDVALKTLDESLRLFQEISYTAVHESRMDHYDTLGASDDMNANHAIVSANSGTDVFVIAGNYAERFRTGVSFRANGTVANDATYTSTGAVYDPATNQTTVSVAAVAATEGAGGYLLPRLTFLFQDGTLTFSNRSVAGAVQGVDYNSGVPY